ncbi:MAG TPA: ligase-associated DNA damage response exonuclease [Polyangia bacterium]|nr:ligase-associated DNA damage response exonuclease [Polyangia bacterium]
MLAVTPAGLYCARGGFHIDPWQPVERALITHAHADHARPGSVSYLCAAPCAPLLAARVGAGAEVRSLAYGETLTLDGPGPGSGGVGGGIAVSFHPSGHILGAAQIRLQAEGAVWVVSGDYKRAPDPTCPPFEPLRCDVFVSEASYALPIYRWDEPAAVIDEIVAWWDAAAAAARAAVLFCYALGKGQRILAELALRRPERTVFVHGALASWLALYRAAGVRLPPTELVVETQKGRAFAGELVLAPPSARGSVWMRRFGEHETGFASGWMRVRGTRRRQGYDRGFALSDHADWPSLLQTVRETGARRVLTMHGFAEPLARHLREQGVEASALSTPALTDED